MKRSLFILALCLGTIDASAQTLINNFNKSLATNFDQKTKTTFGKQVLLANIDLLGIVIPAYLDREQATVKSLQKKINNISSSRLLSETEKDIRIRRVRVQLSGLESQLAKKTGAKSVRHILRGTQIFFVIDLGTRVYVLTQLRHSDPGFIPLLEIACDPLNCDKESEDALEAHLKNYDVVNGKDSNELGRN